MSDPMILSMLMNWIPVIVVGFGFIVPLFFLVGIILVLRYLSKLSSIDRTLKSIEKLLREKKPE